MVTLTDAKHPSAGSRLRGPASSSSCAHHARTVNHPLIVNAPGVPLDMQDVRLARSAVCLMASWSCIALAA